MKSMKLALLTPAHIDFLLNYCPANLHFTTTAEMNLVIERFNLNEISDIEMYNLRNAVVSFFTELMENEIMFDSNGKYKGRTDKFWTYNTAMQSVTAVMDHVMYK